MSKNQHTRKSLSARCLAASLALALLSANVTAYAAAPKTEVEEKLYINMDAYGTVDTANVVKGIQFRSAKDYTDYGNYTEIINMSDDSQPVRGEDSVTWTAPETKTKFYFQGGLDPEQVKLPWTFDVSYRLNGMPVEAEELKGASGTVEIRVDAIPDKNVSNYMQDNMILMVLIPLDTAEVSAIDAPDSMEASFGNYSGIGFEALPGKEGHFTASIGTESFESMGVMMIMSPVTVSDLSKIKDLKEIEDKFRTNTNAMMDSMEAIMDNVSDMSEQMEKTNQILDELANGKNHLDNSRTIIFDGIDVSLQDIRDLSALLDPVDTSIKTTQWMVYELNQNLNDTDSALMNCSSVMGTLSKKLRSLSSEMAVSNTYNISSVVPDLNTTKGALNALKRNLAKGGTAVGNMKTITGSAQFEHDSENLLYEYVTDEAEYEEEYLPQAVIGVINASLPADKTAITAAMLDAKTAEIASLLDIYTYLHADNVPVSAADLGIVAGGLKAAKEQAAAGHPELAGPALAAALGQTSRFSGHAADPAYLSAMLSSLSTVSGSASDNASRFVERVKSMLKLEQSLESLESGNYGAGSNLKDSLGDLSDAGTEALANAIAAYSSVDYDTLFTQVNTALTDLDEVMDAGASVSYQTSRLLDSLRKLCSSLDALTATMNNYYEDVQTALTNTSNVVEQTEKLADDFAGTMQVLNNTLRAASEDFSKAGDDSIALGHDAVDNSEKMIENTRNMKEAGAELRRSINEELDREEAENNFLNMDPDAVKESLTSTKNPEPASVQIICRTAEIRKDKAAAVTDDAEIEEVPTTIWQRIGNIFRSIWQKISGLFGK